MNDPKTVGIIMSCIVLSFAFVCGFVIGALVF